MFLTLNQDNESNLSKPTQSVKLIATLLDSWVTNTPSIKIMCPPPKKRGKKGGGESSSIHFCGVTWTLTQTAEQMLNTFERKILRRIYGPTQEGGRWHPRWNNELYSLYNEPNIMEDIKIRRLGWAGHIMRMKKKGPQRRF
jgi:hypothetical protein